MKRKILLLMQPFWTPLIPPQGISYLKNFLQHHNYIVKTVDANTQEQFRELYNRYFGLLQKYIPVDKQGNFFNIGHDVLRNHMMAHIHYEDEGVYGELVKILIYQTYFTVIGDAQVNELNDVLDLFYARMKRYILDLLEREKPEVLGISVLRDTIAPSMFAFRLAGEKYPDVMTVMGGSVFSDHLRIDSPNFEYFLEKTPYIDKIIVGEGQILFLKLLRGELPETQRVFTLKDIEGETLNYSVFDYKFPDMTDFDVERDYPYLAAQGSGSCPNQCSFCNVAAFYGKYKEKDAGQTVTEMITLYKMYGKQLFFMNDALLNGVATELSGEFLKSGTALYWDGYLRVDPDVCNPENTICWRRGGMYRVRLGVESGSQHVLDLMDKGITPGQTRAALASLANAGIKTTTYWVIGHPGETEADFSQTLELLEELKNDIYEAECNPFIFGYTGQAKTRRWEDKRVLLYPEEANDMLVIRTWRVDCPPSREETYERVNRFAGCCRRLGIPNPYSLREIYQADNRWEILHKNAVPPLVDFRKRKRKRRDDYERR
jgi:radical SAM superfamily enzyme YgiQ (UPF0313 family)